MLIETRKRVVKEIRCYKGEVAHKNRVTVTLGGAVAGLLISVWGQCFPDGYLSNLTERRYLCTFVRHTASPACAPALRYLNCPVTVQL